MAEVLSRANVAYETGDLQLALQWTRRHLRCFKDDVRGWELVGLIQFGRGRTRVSVSALERASLIAPLRPAARVCLARGYAQLGHSELARELLVEMISDQTFSVPMLLQVATGLDEVDQPHLAMKACREAVQREAGSAQAYYDQGYYAARCGLPVSASEALTRKAVSLEPQRVSFRIGLVVLLLKQDRTEAAYNVIRNFSDDQIDEVCCACCLMKIAPLYREFGDTRRAILCQQRIISLELEQ
jgi:Flp pilus assembly protein TadD